MSSRVVLGQTSISEKLLAIAGGVLAASLIVSSANIGVALLTGYNVLVSIVRGGDGLLPEGFRQAALILFFIVSGGMAAAAASFFDSLLRRRHGN